MNDVPSAAGFLSFPPSLFHSIHSTHLFRLTVKEGREGGGSSFSISSSNSPSSLNRKLPSALRPI